MPLRLEFCARSGGMGKGNLPKPEHNPPPGWEPKIITSTIRGVEIKKQPPQPPQPKPH